MNEGPFFYKIRLGKGTPYSALKVWRGFPKDNITGDLLLERPLLWRAFLNGEDIDVADIAIEFDPVTGAPVVKGDLVSEEDYLLTMKTILWAKAHVPDAPEANPKNAIDHLKGDLIF